jgi:Ni/Co efflux regulator RcnB
MKRIALAAIAAATFAAPLAISTTAAADPPRHERRGDRDYDRHDDRRSDRGWDRRDRDYDNRDDRRDERRAYRDGRRDGRWDRARHNGYEYRGRWNYGPPPQAYYNDHSYRPGYHAWRRGDRLPGYYRDNYRRVDYRRHGLRAPPRGYDYYEDDRGDYLLVGIATGVILGIIASN